MFSASGLVGARSRHKHVRGRLNAASGRSGLLVLLSAIFVGALLTPANAADGRGSFVVGCEYSHDLLDDPIVYPGRPGASHLHDFFGNVTANANSTRDRMLLGQTTCNKNWDDTAGYWSPSAYMDGAKVTPIRQRLYYFGSAKGSVETFPANLKVVAGNARATSPSENPEAAWNCGGTTQLSTHPYDCRPFLGTATHADGVVGNVDLPECWDGTRLDSADHMSHMAYKIKGSGCPASHPHELPRLRLRIHYGIADPCLGLTPCGPTDPDTNVRLTLSSGPYWTLHADFWNTWKQAPLDRLVEICLNAHQTCGPVGAVTPNAPVLSTAAGSGVVQLSWMPPSSNSSGITNYKIYRATASGEASREGSFLTTVGNVTAYDDTEVADNTTYHYLVVAVNSFGPGLPSNEASATPQPPTFPSAPVLTATAGDGTAHLSWTAPADGGSSITGYRIYRATTSGAETFLVDPGNVTTYEDTGLTNETTYFYQVSAVNALGEGSRSDEKSVTPQVEPVPAAPVLTASDAKGKGVRLTWTAPSDGGSPITGYRIYRATTSGAETFLVDLGNITTYKDTTTKRGFTYYYQVSALNSSGEGPKSNEASATDA